ncbi:F-box only protein 33-like [Hetaerina americana]|uniref:F-box only protein 33-like n=1 Tax=Hetaerina americana TaxID=62018 RepID=UPI003A7F1ADA
MDILHGCWENLPSVILLEIFSYLSHEDKIRASSVCRQWRCTLFHSTFLRSIHFKARTEDLNSLARTRYLSSCFAKKLRNAIVSLDSLNPLCVREVARVLQKLSENSFVRRLILKPSHCRFECPGIEREKLHFIERNIISPLKTIIKHSRELEALSLGCSEELATYSCILLNLLGRFQSRSLRQLHLASVKDDPNNYIILDLDYTLFQPFHMLQVLSLDYDYVSDSLLEIFTKPSNGGLKCLIIHVHGITKHHPNTSNQAWSLFCQYNPLCELRLTLIHSYDAVEILHSDILRPRMPLTHLKAFFCEQVNLATLNLLSVWYYKTLRSVWWVDSFPSALLIDAVNEGQPDPLVMAAWRCTHLEELVLLGYRCYDADLVAIARLRGPKLKRLDVTEEDIVDFLECESFIDLQYEVSQALKRNWQPISSENLHDVIHKPSVGDSDEFILPVVLQDQDW